MSATTFLLASTCAALLGQHDDPVFQAKDIQVKKHYARLQKARGAPLPYHTLLFHGINIGTNFLIPAKDPFESSPDLSRLATTYYHRNGPAGRVLERFDWFPGPANTYWADVRLPASLVGVGAATLGTHALPAGALLAPWSEPPIAVLGIEVGTMASYARPLQHVHFFERNPEILKLAQPAKDRTQYFRYVGDALDRGAGVRIFPGELRATFAKSGADRFYHAIILNSYKDGIETVHTDLLTREGISLCMGKLAPDGILCIHISNRYYDMMPIIADVANELGLACYHGTDQAPWRDEEDLGRIGHFSSEWAMLARADKSLKALTTPQGYDKEVQRNPGWKGYSGKFWQVPKATGKYAWTDESKHSFTGLYRSDPGVRRLDTILYKVEDFLGRYVNQSTVMNACRPLHELVDSLDQYVVGTRNAPPKK